MFIKQNNNLRGFIQIPLLIVIVVGVLIVGSASYVGVKQYQNYKAEKIGQERAERERERQEVQKEKGKQDAEIAELKTKLTDLANKSPAKPQIIYNTIEKIVEQPKEKSMADIAKEWSPLVVYIFCEWHHSDGTIFAQGSGSGSLNVFIDETTAVETIAVLTNLHVLLNEGLYSPTYCDTYLLNGEKYRTFSGINNYGFWSGYDIGVIILPNPSAYTKNVSYGGSYCSTEPEIGDKIVVLGYPGIGSSSGITVTEGIISGYEGDYYVTSAKIDRGNSGGIAVSVKDNCVVGMPSASVKGSLESLGRILKTKTISGLLPHTSDFFKDK